MELNSGTNSLRGVLGGRAPPILALSLRVLALTTISLYAGMNSRVVLIITDDPLMSLKNH